MFPEMEVYPARSLRPSCAEMDTAVMKLNAMTARASEIRAPDVNRARLRPRELVILQRTHETIIKDLRFVIGITERRFYARGTD